MTQQGCEGLLIWWQREPVFDCVEGVYESAVDHASRYSNMRKAGQEGEKRTETHMIFNLGSGYTNDGRIA